mgnify:CR=1 FL=1|tara:strand:+ start:259 stop:957 length:699 start_codon:yes stop_codon:yes gene_type:complete
MEYIYIIRNKINGKYYLGSTIQLRVRKLKHFNELRKNKHHCIHLQRAFNKYKEDNFEFIIIETCFNSKTREQELLNSIDFKDCYNVSKSASGGDLISNHPDREEIIKRNTEILKAAPRHNKDYSKENNPNWRGGTTFCKCGNRINSSTKQCHECRDITGENNPFFGKTHSEETKKKLSELRKGKYNGNQNKYVIIEGKEYSSLGQAAKALNVSVGTIYNRIKNPKFGEYQYK